jgi:hypothetical protein
MSANIILVITITSATPRMLGGGQPHHRPRHHPRRPWAQSRTMPHPVSWTRLKPNKFDRRPTKTMSPAFVMHGDRHDHRTKNRIGFVK